MIGSEGSVKGLGWFRGAEELQQDEETRGWGTGTGVGLPAHRRKARHLALSIREVLRLS